jgi:hypothetical protein
MDHIRTAYDAIQAQAINGRTIRLEEGLSRDLGRTIVRQHPAGTTHTHGARDNEFMQYDEFVITPYMQRGLVAIGIGVGSPSSHIQSDLVALWLPSNVHFDYDGAEHVASLETADLANRSPFFVRSLLVQPRFCGLAAPKRGVYGHAVRQTAHSFFGDAKESCETRVLDNYGLVPITNRGVVLDREKLLDLAIVSLLKGNQELDTYLNAHIMAQIEERPDARERTDAVLTSYERQVA